MVYKKLLKYRLKSDKSFQVLVVADNTKKLF